SSSLHQTFSKSPDHAPASPEPLHRLSRNPRHKPAKDCNSPLDRPGMASPAKSRPARFLAVPIRWVLARRCRTTLALAVVLAVIPGVARPSHLPHNRWEEATREASTVVPSQPAHMLARGLLARNCVEEKRPADARAHLAAIAPPLEDPDAATPGALLLVIGLK